MLANKQFSKILAIIVCTSVMLTATPVWAFVDRAERTGGGSVIMYNEGTGNEWSTSANLGSGYFPAYKNIEIVAGSTDPGTGSGLKADAQSVFDTLSSETTGLKSILSNDHGITDYTNVAAGKLLKVLRFGSQGGYVVFKADPNGTDMNDITKIKLGLRTHRRMCVRFALDFYSECEFSGNQITGTPTKSGDTLIITSADATTNAATKYPWEAIQKLDTGADGVNGYVYNLVINSDDIPAGTKYVKVAPDYTNVFGTSDWTTAFNGASFNIYYLGFDYKTGSAPEPSYQLEYANGDINVEVQNADITNLQLILASYTNTGGKRMLKNVEVVSLDNKLTDGSYSYDVNQFDANGGTEIKAFLWDDITPVSESKLIG